MFRVVARAERPAEDDHGLSHHSIGYSRTHRDEPRDTLPTAATASRPCAATPHAHAPSQAEEQRDGHLRSKWETGGA